MLVVASTVFLYYTIWTLFLVLLPNKSFLLSRLNTSELTMHDSYAALRGRVPPSAIALSTSRLGHSNSCHTPFTGWRGSGKLSERGHDT